ncbi:DUF6262 family protein [Mycobacteroides abscessus]|uniref:DUF6262 family protein n=2 Tax=Mycobacteroides abscessus TaxID=36809 RepID=UPI00373FD5C7
MGLLEQALQLDLRRPQDYFRRVWSMNFPVAALAELDSTAESDCTKPRSQGLPMNASSRLAAAQASRRAQTNAMLTPVQDVLGQTSGEQELLTVSALAQRASVSRTFLYQNHQARRLLRELPLGTKGSRARQTRQINQPAWRERALNAEDALATAYRESRHNATRSRICSAESAT